MEASWWETLIEAETGSCSGGQVHAQQIFNPIFCWWAGMCSSPLFYLRPNYSRGNEDSGDLPQKVPMHTLLHSVPPKLLQATTDPRLYQRLLDTPGQVWVSLLCGNCSFLLGPGELKVLFEPSECLWWAWGLILNVILPLLPSWGLSFALGCGVSPQSSSSTMQPLLQWHEWKPQSQKTSQSDHMDGSPV